MTSPAVASDLSATRESWHRVAEHVLAAGQFATAGTIRLRPQPGGFATVVGVGGRQLAVDGDRLVVTDGSGVRSIPFSTVGHLAEFVGIRAGLSGSYPPTTRPFSSAAERAVPGRARPTGRNWGMTDTAPSLAELAAEEEELQFAGFDNDDAWALGAALAHAARKQHAPVAVDVRRNSHQLFHAALPGATPDNDSWIQRKTRVVNRFGHSTLYMRQASIERGTTFEAQFGLDPAEFAAHGGGFPILVRNVGPIGVVVVSGLPQLEDHRMVVTAIRAQLAR